MDRITLHGVRVWAHHGVAEHERRIGQPFVVDVTVETDLGPAAASDDLADTIDYSDLVRRVAAAARQGPHHLIETVAARVLDAVLDDQRVAAAEVTVHKPRAALAVEVGDVTVTLRRERPPP